MDRHDWILAGLWIVYSMHQAWQARRAASTRYTDRDPLHKWGLLAIVTGLALTMTALGDLWIMGVHFVPEGDVWYWGGFTITALALMLAAWARHRLGSFWSNRIEIKNGHRLIQAGPYRFVRHPIYSGLILAAAGSAIADGDLGAAIGFTMIAVSFLVRLKREERLIAETFGAEWDAWRARTWALIPYVV